MALLTFEQFINESNQEDSRVKVKYQDKEGTIEALDYTQAGSNDLIEFLHDGARKMVPKHQLTVLD